MLRALLQSLWRSVFQRSQIEQDMADELQFHLAKRADDLMNRDGLQPSEAFRRARLEFGGVERYKEACRQARGARWIDEIMRNLLYALRSMRKHPGFTAVAVLSLALGIGANLAVFSVLHRLVLTKLPVHDPDRLYQITVVRTDRTWYRLPFPNFELMRAHRSSRASARRHHNLRRRRRRAASIQWHRTARAGHVSATSCVRTD